MKPNGYLIFKSDNDDLYQYSLEEITLSPFKLISKDDDYQLLSDDVETEYEHKFRSLGNKIHRFILRKE